MAAWDIFGATYDNKSLDYSNETTVTIHFVFGKDGERLYIVEQKTTPALIYQYNLSTAWDISTASYANKSISVGTANPVGIDIKSDGNRIYVLTASNGTLYYWDLSTSWELDSAGSRQSGDNMRTGTENNIRDFYFKRDGTKLYDAGLSSGKVYEWDVSPAWDAAGLTFNQSKDLSATTTSMITTVLSSDGTSMIITENSNSTINKFVLSTGFDISTASGDSTFDSSSQTSTVTGMDFKSDGTKFYLVGNTENRIFQYSVASDGVINRKIKIAGTFQDKPIKTKVGGTFVDKSILAKVGGTFQ